MIHQPPAGARDLLPLEVAQKAWINDRLQAIFHRWGYQRIVTSTLEWLDTLTAGGAIAPETVMQLRDSAEGVLGLRPELTASIARAAVTRMNEPVYPQRFCYRANVFRQPPQGYHGKQLEFFQAGVELLFAGGVLADAEILLLLSTALQDLGLPDSQIVLGEAGLTRSLLAQFPPHLQNTVRDSLIRLDYVQLAALDYPQPDLKNLALTLFDLRGAAGDVLTRISQLPLDSDSQQRVSYLKTLVEVVQQSQENPPMLVLDLSWLQPFDYYTGIVFQAVTQTGEQWRVLGQGGRYDQLLSLYHPQHQPFPGIGFSLNIEDLHASLLGSPLLPAETPALDWLVIAREPGAEIAAFRYAHHLRQRDSHVRVEVDLGGRSPEPVRNYAHTQRVQNLAWVNGQGDVELETLSKSP
ncbi:MAG: ATP phosphoribosyltransferase regulatory subunit [Merismopediaceae bacterium]|nr:ATP phosphoribosyltransferase regulatory subunit [Merismopediaceae bacterium]